MTPGAYLRQQIAPFWQDFVPKIDAPGCLHYRFAEYEAAMKGKGWMTSDQIATAVGVSRMTANSSLRVSFHPSGFVVRKGGEVPGKRALWRWLGE